jgi:hypothetical protein
MKSLRLVKFVDLLQITIIWFRMLKIISIKFKISQCSTKNKLRQFRIWHNKPKICSSHFEMSLENLNLIAEIEILSYGIPAESLANYQSLLLTRKAYYRRA